MARVGVSEIHGRGLFATRSFVAGEEILREAPLAAMQDVANRAEVLCCGNCLAFLDVDEGVRTQLAAGCLTRQEAHRALEGTVCACACGEMYCDEACRASHRSHETLCVGKISDSDAAAHPLVAFKTLAVESNEILLLAADLLVTDRPAGFVSEKWDDVVRVAATLRGEPPEDGLEENLRDLVATAAALLSEATGRPVTPDDISRVVGMFEQNNVGVRKECDGFPPLEGTALYARCCSANHSCDPNCDILYEGPPFVPLEARLVANRDIEGGDELTISYVDENADTQTRRWATAEYGFLCRCPRCERDSVSSSSSSSSPDDDDVDCDGGNGGEPATQPPDDAVAATRRVERDG
ncbi:hypothetical protein CTAYLR_004678 [Chrysophaeum taylorii]|uniref:SET domain-containing protein n=1 Tax=Chrysophaeum taylorii TaxID=2483200 RepID=A0AAD7XKM0_9STRA|nr:hypothetical protein CTAYLR_004678 [Chrysophaeum taylorii]